jgi:hypothetical protein
MDFEVEKFSATKDLGERKKIKIKNLYVPIS